jgi:hypothetical protein
VFRVPLPSDPNQPFSLPSFSLSLFLSRAHTHTHIHTHTRTHTYTSSHQNTHTQPYQTEFWYRKYRAVTKGYFPTSSQLTTPLPALPISHFSYVQVSCHAPCILSLASVYFCFIYRVSLLLSENKIEILFWYASCSCILTRYLMKMKVL